MKMISAKNIKKFTGELETILHSLQVDAMMWNKFANITQGYLGYKIDPQLQNNITNEIAITWDISDVQIIRPDLTDQQASDVLVYAKKNHDATIGINWETLDYIANALYPIDK